MREFHPTKDWIGLSKHYAFYCQNKMTQKSAERRKLLRISCLSAGSKDLVSRDLQDFVEKRITACPRTPKKRMMRNNKTGNS